MAANKSLFANVSPMEIDLVCGYIRQHSQYGYSLPSTNIIPSSVVQLCIIFYHLRTKDLKEFNILKIIGKGHIAEVRLIRDTNDETLYALNTMKKQAIIDKKKFKYVTSGRNLMVKSESTWLPKLFHCSQDNLYTYMVFEYCPGCDLMGLLMKEDILSEDQTRFFMAEVTAAINAVHNLGYFHRDIKPSNVLIAKDGHIKLGGCDLAETLDFANTNKTSLQTVGTPDYMSPELFSRKGYNHMVDWWALGIILFECICGYPPFYAEDALQTCRKIVHYRKHFKIPFRANVSSECTDLLVNLITSHRRRYSYSQITKHSFFKSVSFEDLLSMKPIFIRDLKTDDDTSNFDAINDSEQDIKLSEFVASTFDDKDHFWGWNFDHNSMDFMYAKDKSIENDIMLQQKMEEMRESTDDKEKNKLVNEYGKDSKNKYEQFDMSIEIGIGDEPQMEENIVEEKSLDENDIIKSEKNSLQTLIDQLLNNQNNMQKEIETLKNDNNELQNKNNTLNEECKELKLELNETKKRINKNMDSNNYKNWHFNEFIDWIICLENGRYEKYENKLRIIFKEEDVDGSVIHTIGKSEWKDWGINNYKDRVNLDKHVKNLINK